MHRKLQKRVGDSKDKSVNNELIIGAHDPKETKEVSWTQIRFVLIQFNFPGRSSRIHRWRHHLPAQQSAGDDIQKNQVEETASISCSLRTNQRCHRDNRRRTKVVDHNEL